MKRPSPIITRQNDVYLYDQWLTILSLTHPIRTSKSMQFTAMTPALCCQRLVELDNIHYPQSCMQLLIAHETMRMVIAICKHISYKHGIQAIETETAYISVLAYPTIVSLFLRGGRVGASMEVLFSPKCKLKLKEIIHNIQPCLIPHLLCSIHNNSYQTWQVDWSGAVSVEFFQDFGQ